MSLAQTKKRLKKLRQRLEQVSPIQIHGRVINAVGTIIRATIANTFIGEMCLLKSPGIDETGFAEVIGIDKDTALLTPLGDLTGISTSTEVVSTGNQHHIQLGDFLLGTLVDGLGRPFEPVQINDDDIQELRPIYAKAPSPLSRKIISESIETGIKVIDCLLTCGRGQRIGLFAAAGVGKSSLLGMLARNATVDIVVVALIGERGREVNEFVEHTLDENSRKKSVLVVSTSDRPAMERLKSAHTATTIAEFFRDQGKNVLLLMDSVTRFARAQREIGLAAGEAPARRGFPPSVFSELPKLLERTGNTQRGSITAIYTVLVEGDDMNEPIADETRSILDGHFILSRDLAAKQQYPAIDPLQSLSRLMTQVASEPHQTAAGKIRTLLAKYEEIELLVRVGEYQKGNDLEADEALAKIDTIRAFFKQSMTDFYATADSLQELIKIAE